MRNGEVVEYKKVRGMTGVWREFERFIDQNVPPDTPVRVGLAHAQAPETVERLTELDRAHTTAGQHRSGVLDRRGGGCPRWTGSVRPSHLARRMRSFDGLESPAFPRPSSAPSPSHLDAPAATGKVLVSGLSELRPPVRTVGDLLEHVPFRHDDFRSAGRLADMDRARRPRLWSRSIGYGRGRRDGATW